MSHVDRPATVGDSVSVWGNQATLIRDYIDCSAGRLLSDNRSGQLSAVWPGPYIIPEQCYYIGHDTGASLVVVSSKFIFLEVSQLLGY